MPEINKPTLLRHIAASDLTAVEKRYLEGLVNTSEPARCSLWIGKSRPFLCAHCETFTDYKALYCPNCGAKMGTEVEMNAVD